MGKRPKDMCPLRYWRAREGNSECHSQVLSMSSKSGDKRTYVWAKAERTCVLLAIECCQCHQSPETTGHMYGQSQTDMCSFSYWRGREGNSECTGKFHPSPETKKK